MYSNPHHAPLKPSLPNGHLEPVARANASKAGKAAKAAQMFK